MAISRMMSVAVCVFALFSVQTMCCITEYHELEQALLREDQNIDNLMRAFFPPNQEQAALLEVFYFTKDSESAANHTVELKTVLGNSCRNQPQYCKHRDEERTNCTYLYRWTISPMYLLAEPRLLNDLSLSILPGTELKMPRVNVIIPEICNTREDQITDTNGDVWDRPVFLLSRLTTFVSCS